jgi:hypothetical protein
LLETASDLPFLPKYKAKSFFVIHISGVNLIFQDCIQAVLVAKMAFIIDSGDGINLCNLYIETATQHTAVKQTVKFHLCNLYIETATQHTAVK